MPVWISVTVTGALGTTAPGGAALNCWLYCSFPKRRDVRDIEADVVTKLTLVGQIQAFHVRVTVIPRDYEESLVGRAFDARAVKADSYSQPGKWICGGLRQANPQGTNPTALMR